MVYVDVCHNIRYGKFDFDDISHLCVFWLYVRIPPKISLANGTAYALFKQYVEKVNSERTNDSENITEYLISVLQQLTVYFSRLH